ncbi:MAG: cyclic nucleotide-binding domain-containing protein [Candidatus Cloacimonas sp.]
MIELETLAKVPLFKDVRAEALVYLQPHFKELEVAKGSVIIKDDTEGDQIFVLVKGSVQVTKDLVRGFDADQYLTNKVLAKLEGDSLPTFGENGLLGHGPRTANIIAVTDCKLYTLAKADFAKFAEYDYQAAYIVMKNIAQKLSLSLKATDDNLVKLATALYIAVQH